MQSFTRLAMHPHTYTTTHHTTTHHTCTSLVVHDCQAYGHVKPNTLGMVLPNTRTIPQVLKRSKKPCNTRSRHPTKIPIQRETPVAFVSGFHKGCHPSTAACMHDYKSGTAAHSPPTRFNDCHPPKPYQPQSMQKGGGTTVRLTGQRSRIHNQPSMQQY